MNIKRLVLNHNYNIATSVSIWDCMSSILAHTFWCRGWRDWAGKKYKNFIIIVTITLFSLILNTNPLNIPVSEQTQTQGTRRGRECLSLIFIHFNISHTWWSYNARSYAGTKTGIHLVLGWIFQTRYLKAFNGSFHLPLQVGHIDYTLIRLI